MITGQLETRGEVWVRLPAGPERDMRGIDDLLPRNGIPDMT